MANPEQLRKAFNGIVNPRFSADERMRIQQSEEQMGRSGFSGPWEGEISKWLASGIARPLGIPLLDSKNDVLAPTDGYRGVALGIRYPVRQGFSFHFRHLLVFPYGRSLHIEEVTPLFVGSDQGPNASRINVNNLAAFNGFFETNADASPLAPHVVTTWRPAYDTTPYDTFMHDPSALLPVRVVPRVTIRQKVEMLMQAQMYHKERLDKAAEGIRITDNDILLFRPPNAPPES